MCRGPKNIGQSSVTASAASGFGATWKTASDCADNGKMKRDANSKYRDARMCRSRPLLRKYDVIELALGHMMRAVRRTIVLRIAAGWNIIDNDRFRRFPERDDEQYIVPVRNGKRF